MNAPAEIWPVRAWSAWCRFWFAPSDPTPLAFMRIMAGLLTIYVHLAYTFDLTEFYGANGWYNPETARENRRNMPHLVDSTRWDGARNFARLPEDADQRRNIREFADRVWASGPTGSAMALEFLATLSREVPEWRVELLRYLRDLPAEPAEQAEALRGFQDATLPADQMELLPPLMRMQLKPENLQRTPEAPRMMTAALLNFLSVCPADPVDRNRFLIYLMDMQDYNLVSLAGFVRELPADPRARRDSLDYAVEWGIEPKHAYALGLNTYSPLFHVSDPAALAWLHAAHLTVMVLFTVGLWTRVTSVLTWLAAITYIHRAQPYLFGQDTMMNMALFYLMFSPCGAVWSVDALIARYRKAKADLSAGRLPLLDGAVPVFASATFALRLFQINYSLMYMSAGMAKLKGELWWRAVAPMYTMANPEFSPLHVPVFLEMLIFLCQNRILWEVYNSAITLFTIYLELVFPILVWTRLRPVMIAAAIALHLGIAVMMGLSVFSLFMFVLLVCFIPAAPIRWVFSRRPTGLPAIAVTVNPRDAAQARSAAAVAALDVWTQAEWSESSNDAIELKVDGRTSTGSAVNAAVRDSLAVPRAWRWLPVWSFVINARDAASPSSRTGSSDGRRRPVGVS